MKHLTLVCLLACGCGAGEISAEIPRFTAAAPLAVQPVEWNAGKTDVGTIAAVTELEDDVLVFSNKGVFLLSGGANAAHDPSVLAFRAAATIPAGDGNGEWAVGVDDKGRVHRLAMRTTLEDVTDRYGLGKDPVRSVLRLGDRVAFVLGSQLAVADGVLVKRYDQGPLGSLAGHGTRLAGITAEGAVQVLDLAGEQRLTYPTSTAVALAFTAEGTLYVASQHELFVEERERRRLVRLFKNEAVTFSAMASSASWIWIVAGPELYALHDGQLLGTSGLALPPGAAAISSPTGDLWLLAAGALTRFALPASGDEALWRDTVRPVYARLCSPCHAPTSPGGIPLSTYDQWAAKRAAVYDRVITKGDMPQGRAITDGEKKIIADWAKARP